jgi:hypothetical protein
MQLNRKHSNRFCPIGCRCRTCRQLPHSGLGIDRRQSSRGGIWLFVFAMSAIMWGAAILAAYRGGLFG